MALADMAAKAAPGPDAPDGGGDTFKKPDIASAIPPEQQDAVQRIVAAGMKLMYSPGMRDELRKAVSSPDPTPKVLSENVVGLLLTMDQKAGKGGLPAPALMPAAVELLGEAGDAMVQAGRAVTQEDFKTSIQMTFVLMSKKMGMNDAQIMDTANKALPPEEQVGGGAPPDGPAADAAAQEPPPQAPPTPAGGAGPVPPAGAGAPPVDPNAPPPEQPQP